jgi:molybdate transport system substrate-binding protein
MLCIGCGKTGSGSGAGDGTGKGDAPRPVRVAAAADLKFAFEDMGKAFEAKTQQKVSFSFGSTGLLAKQVEEGAPFDVFAAANESFVDEVIKSGQCAAETKTPYAEGRIVVWGKNPNVVPPTIAELGSSAVVKLGIANPEHAPYGRAAEQAMRKSGVWDSSKKKLVYAENVQQALTYAQTGNTEFSVVALSLAVVSGGAYTPIDSSLHEPLRQAMVVCKGGVGNARGKAFAAFVGSTEGREIMRRYGFFLPGEARDQ